MKRSAFSRSTSANWWKFLVVGAGVLGAVIVATNLTGEVDDAVWLPMFVSTLVSLALVATGLVLGAIHLTAGRDAKSR